MPILSKLIPVQSERLILVQTLNSYICEKITYDDQIGID